MDENKTHIIIPKIITSLITLLIIISLFSTFVSAETIKTDTGAEKTWGSTVKNMPQRSLAGPSGMFPQYWEGTIAREVTLSESRWDLKTNKWAANSNGSVVYCGAYNRTVRFGQWDSRKYYFYKPETLALKNVSIGTTAHQSYKSAQEWLDEILSVLKDGIGDREAEQWNRTGHYYVPTVPQKRKIKIRDYVYAELGPGLDPDWVGFPILEPGWWGAFPIQQQIQLQMTKANTKSAAQGAAMQIARSLFEVEEEEHKPDNIEGADDINDKTNPVTTVSATKGPTVTVMEQDKDQYFGSEKYGYSRKESGTYDNNARGYIFSASENAYGEPEYAKKYNLNDIQGAYWLDLHEKGEGDEPTTKITSGANQLFQKALEYEEFAESGSYSTSINDSKAQVIADAKEILTSSV